jgi:diacylglycerol kinase (ATP)
MKRKMKPFTVLARIQSFFYAGRGMKFMIGSQHNAWLHALATILIITAGFLIGINKTEWGLVILSIIAVWTAEALNTAFEFLADVSSPGSNPLVMKAKDIAAAAVLIAATGALAIGLIIFIPYLAEFFK